MQDIPSEKPPRVIFAISLKPRQMSDDWELVQRNLKATLRSINASSSNNYLAVIACHDPPDVGDLENEKLLFLPVPFDSETDWQRGAIDKVRKRRYIGAWLRNQLTDQQDGEAGSYVMFLDADDLVHKDLVEFIVRDDNRMSYIVSKGYVFDAAGGRFARFDSFDRSCGSCFVGYFTKDELPKKFDDEDCAYYHFDRHDQFKSAAERLGKRPTVVPFYAMIYVTNHPESLKRKRLGGQNRTHGKHKYSNRTARKILLENFSYADYPEKPFSYVEFVGGTIGDFRIWLRGKFKRRGEGHLKIKSAEKDMGG